MEKADYIVVRGTVVNNSDPYGGNRIQVRLGNVYDGLKDDSSLPYCSPLLPKLIHIVPKVGELVLVFLEKLNSGDSTRLYIGPVLSQPQRYNNELSSTAQAFLDSPNGESNTTLNSPTNNQQNIGSIPDIKDVALIGRDNCNIVMKESELRIMCGYKGSKPDDLEFNRKDPAFIQLKWKERGDEGKSIDSSLYKYKSSINVFADRINLLSKGSDINIGDFDNVDLLTPEQMEKIIETAHPLVYGDKLVEYLTAFRTAFLAHTHPFSMLPPVMDANVSDIATSNLNSMLSETIKTC